MFGRATITLGIGPHSSFLSFQCCLIGIYFMITFRVSRRRREMYIAHPCLCVCLSLSAC